MNHPLKYSIKSNGIDSFKYCTFQVDMGFGILLHVHLIWLHCQRFVLGWLYRLRPLLSRLRIWLWWWRRRYAFDYIFSPIPNGRKKLFWADCNRPTSQLALMIVNIFAIIISAFVTILVSRPLCFANKPTTQNRVNSTVRVATIDTPSDTPDLVGTRTVVMRKRIYYA